MAQPSPVSDEDQERRQQLFHEVWGHAYDLASRSRGRPAETEDVIEIPEAQAPAATPGQRIDELERDVRRLEEVVVTLRRTTEEGFREVSTTMLRLVEAVRAATTGHTETQTRA